MRDVGIAIDGIVYRLAFGGFDCDMQAWSPSGARIGFKPWLFREHLAALDACALATAAGLRLNAVAFGHRVLAYSEVPESLHAEFLPLALWWACGGGAAETVAARAGEYEFGTVRARIRPWNGAERYRALSQCRSEGEGSGLRFRLGAYLRAMVEASVVFLDPPDLSADHLDSASATAMLNTVLTINVCDPEAPSESPLYAPEAARQTLRLCRGLGWSPSQVWATPAAELDRLSALLDRVHPQSAAVARSPRSPTLADHPDAVLIRIEDD